MEAITPLPPVTALEGDLLTALTLEDCAPEFNPPAETWDFPCGLRVASELMPWKF